MGCASSTTAVETFDSPPPVPSKAKAVPERDFHRDYALTEKLGQGAYGVVYATTQIESPSTKLVVKVVDLRDAESKDLDFDEKMMRLDRRSQKSIMHEMAILRAVRGHENLIHMTDRFVHGGLAYIVLERCDRSLYAALDSCADLTEDTVRPFFHGMLTGIAAIHSRRIVHRDIKPDNFMCCGSDDTVKLCDFGLACAITPQGALTHTEYFSICGTAAYIAPEMLQKEAYGAKVDVWSFGVVVHVLLRGSFPYTSHENTRSSTVAAILHGVPTPDIFLEAKGKHSLAGEISEEARRFVVNMLSRCSKKRPTSQEALLDEFFTTQSLSQTCLRRKLAAAKRCGAFEDSNAMRADIGDVDLRLRHLQDRRGELAVAQTPSPASDASTDTGSSLGESVAWQSVTAEEN